MNNFIYLFLIPFILSSCYSNRINNKTTLGRYEAISFYGIGSSIELKENGTFKYDWQTGLMRGTTHGKWRREGREIILNSNLQPSKEKNNSLIRSEYRNLDSLEVRVFDKNNETIPSANCILISNNKIIEGTTVNLSGLAILPKIDADSIRINSFTYKDIVCEYDVSKDYYEFRLEETNYHYKYFVNEVWRIKKDKWHYMILVAKS